MLHSFRAKESKPARLSIKTMEDCVPGMEMKQGRPNLCVCAWRERDLLWDYAIMEAKKTHDLLSASWRTTKTSGV